MLYRLSGFIPADVFCALSLPHLSFARRLPDGDLRIHIDYFLKSSLE
jgi:hypothetical protein